MDAVARLGLVTYDALPALQDDDRLLQTALTARGHEARPVVWTDASIDWRGFDALVLRSCWDYHLQPDSFGRWVDGIESAGVRLVNRPAIVRWNMDKRYLADLRGRGVLTVPTRFLEPGEFSSCDALRRETGWDDIVLKPAVSATAWRLARVPDAGEVPADVRDAMTRDRYLAQPFLPEIAEGEWSIVFFDGVYSHAVLKRPRAGEFRVQEEYGGAAATLDPPNGFIAAAARAVAAAPAPPVYARVDGVATRDGFMLIELELIEPMLYLAAGAGAAARFADAIEAGIRSTP
jgi:glutathione synthase/RimK-type ligase-like ATP-grasp enzyme